jgi:NADPH:quinone reductase-like Zn-dependent oxidoreductase
LDFLRKIGANLAVDYETERFQDLVHEVDRVLDTVGTKGIAEDSMRTLRRGGMFGSVVQPPSSKEFESFGLKSTFFVVKPDRSELVQIANLIDDHKVSPIIDRILPLQDDKTAYERGASGHNLGKTVLHVA